MHAANAQAATSGPSATIPCLRSPPRPGFSLLNQLGTFLDSLVAGIGGMACNGSLRRGESPYGPRMQRYLGITGSFHGPITRGFDIVTAYCLHMHRSPLCLHVVCEVYKHPVASAYRAPTHFLHFFPRASELRPHYGDARFVQQYAWPLTRGSKLRLAVWTRSKVLHFTCHCPRGFRERCGQPSNRRGCYIWKRQHHIPSARSRC